MQGEGDEKNTPHKVVSLNHRIVENFKQSVSRPANQQINNLLASQPLASQQTKRHIGLLTTQPASQRENRLASQSASQLASQPVSQTAASLLNNTY